MRYKARIKSQTAPLEFNATPMIDVIFLLTVFFMLVSRFASAEHVKMEIPDPNQSQARPDDPPDRIILNVTAIDAARPEMGAVYQLGPNTSEGLGDLSGRLRQIKDSRGTDLKIIIRADKRLHYRDVHALMEIVSNSGFESLFVAARAGNAP